MKIDCSEIIKTLHGEPIKYMEKDATLGLLIGEAYANNTEGEKLTDLQTRLRYAQAVEFARADILEVDVKVVEEAKELINKRWPLPIAGPVLAALQVQIESQISTKKKKVQAA